MFPITLYGGVLVDNVNPEMCLWSARVKCNFVGTCKTARELLCSPAIFSAFVSLLGRGLERAIVRGGAEEGES